ncbi:MAG: hypothetical protein ABI968_11880, partial [Acidobacteriota bacterium]
RHPEDWSPDGRFLSFGVVQANARDLQIWILDMAGERHVAPFAKEPAAWDQANSRFSPDGRWVAYNSDETGRSEVYVQAFPGPGGKWQASTSGGSLPIWRPDGKELFYLSLDNTVMAVPVVTDGTFRAGSPAALFPVNLKLLNQNRVYDVSPDGSRFLVNSQSADPGSPPLELLVHWTALLGKS